MAQKPKSKRSLSMDENNEVEFQEDEIDTEEMKRNKLIYLELQEYSPYPNILDG